MLPVFALAPQCNKWTMAYVNLAFWSNSLTESQKSWFAYQRELYACYASIKYFQCLLGAKEFILKTDHFPIVGKFHSNTLAIYPHQQRIFDYIAQMINKEQHLAGFPTSPTLCSILLNIQSLTSMPFYLKNPA